MMLLQTSHNAPTNIYIRENCREPDKVKTYCNLLYMYIDGCKLNRPGPFAGAHKKSGALRVRVNYQNLTTTPRLLASTSTTT